MVTPCRRPPAARVNRAVARRMPTARHARRAGPAAAALPARGRTPDRLDAVLARAVRRRASASQVDAAGGPRLMRVRDSAVGAPQVRGVELATNAKIVIKGLDSSDIDLMVRVLYKQGETVGDLKALLAGNYPMSYASVTQKPTALGKPAPALDDAKLNTFTHGVTIDVPPEATGAVDDAGVTDQAMRLKYLKLYELGQLDATLRLKGLLDSRPKIKKVGHGGVLVDEEDPLWILPSDFAYSFGDVKNVQEIAGRSDLAPMLRIGDVYAAVTFTGENTWPDIVRRRFAATGGDKATKFTIFTGTHGNIGGQKLNPDGTHWDVEAGTLAGAADFPEQDRKKAEKLRGDLNGCDIKVLDVWDKAGKLRDPTTGTRGESDDPDNMLVEPTKLKAAVKAELGAGRVVVMAWCYSVEAFNVARYAGAPVLKSERGGQQPPLLSETAYVAARNAIALKTIVTELFDGGDAAWTRPLPPPPQVPKVQSPPPPKKWPTVKPPHLVR